MTGRSQGVYHRCMMGVLLYLRRTCPASRMAFTVFTGCLWLTPLSEALAERPPLTKNVPVWEFQNHGQESGYDFDAPPKGMFHTIQTAESFDQEMGFRRTYDFVPVNPTEQFRTDSPAVFVVFTVHEHYASFQVRGRCYPEDVEGLASSEVVAEDAVELHLEDNSGYLQFFPPPGGWKPGKYKVEVHVGFQVTGYSLVGTMRFTVS